MTQRLCKNCVRWLHKRHGLSADSCRLIAAVRGRRCADCGLRGEADTDNDGWVTTAELYNYVKKNVSDATNEVQIPVLRHEKDFRLGRVR